MGKALTDKLKAHPAGRALRPFLRPVYFAVLKPLQLLFKLRTPFVLSKYNKLHLGSGPHQKLNWANIDIAGRHNIIWDLRRRLPIRAGTVRFIYSEHFIEHLGRPEALLLLSDCKRLLAEGGVARISTPDLCRCVNDYLTHRIPQLPGIAWHPETPCRGLNEAMRSWGHQFLYDEMELASLLREAGFKNIRRMPWGESEHEELRGLETRPLNDDLIFEAC